MNRHRQRYVDRRYTNQSLDRGREKSSRNEMRDESRDEKRISSKKQSSKKRHSSSSESSDDEKRKKKHKKDCKEKRSRSGERRKDKYGLTKRRSPSRSKSDSSGDERIKSSKQIEIEEYKKRIEKLKNLKKNDEDKVTKNVSNKLSEEEKRRRLEEMQDNAKWRSNVRDSNIKTYRHDDKREEEIQKESRHSHADASNMFK